MEDKMYEQTVREIINNDYCGIETFVEKVFEPIFGINVCLYRAPMSILVTMDQFGTDSLCMGEIYGMNINPIYIYNITVSDNSFNLENAQKYLTEFLRKDFLCFSDAFIILNNDDFKERAWRFYFAHKSKKCVLKESSFTMGKYFNCEMLQEKLCNMFKNRNVLTTELIYNLFGIS